MLLSGNTFGSSDLKQNCKSICSVFKFMMASLYQVNLESMLLVLLWFKHLDTQIRNELSATMNVYMVSKCNRDEMEIVLEDNRRCKVFQEFKHDAPCFNLQCSAFSVMLGRCV